jgi:hypothetical protein
MKITDINSSFILWFMKKNLVWQTVGSCQIENYVLKSVHPVALL